MRSRTEIEADGKRTDLLILEVLLDIREKLPDIRALPEDKPVTSTKKRMGRPKGSKNKVRRTRKAKAI